MKATRLLSALLIVAFLPLDALALRNTGEDVLNVGKPGSTANKELRLGTGKIFYEPSVGKLKFTNDGTIFKEVGSGSGSGSGIVLNGNTGFEDGLDQWTFSPGTASITNSDKAFGNNAMVFAPTAAGQYLRGQGVVVPPGLANKACTLSWYYTGGAANVVARVWNGTSAIAASPVLGNITGAWSAKKMFAFTCGAAGSIMYPEFYSQGADSIKVDEVKLGLETIQNPAPQGSQHVGTYIVTGCSGWNNAGSGDYSVDFSVASGCVWTPDTGTNTAEISPPTTNLPGLLFNKPDPNYVYTVEVAGFIGGNGGAANQRSYFRLHDGTTLQSDFDGFASDTNAAVVVLGGKITGTYKPTNSTPAVVRFRANTGGSSASQIAQWAGRIVFTVSKQPKSMNVDASQGISVENTGWRIDATIGGANPALSSATNATYTTPANSSLDLQLQEGSSPAMIGCVGTTDASGLTCSGADEQTAISFPTPGKGTYEACFSFGHNYGVSAGGGYIGTTFQIMETANNSQTVIQQGKETAYDFLNPNSAVTQASPVKVCGTFKFSDAGRRTLRLMYTVSANSAINHLILGDRDTVNNGGRQIKVTVVRKVDEADVIKVTPPANSVLTGRPGGLKFETVRVSGAQIDGDQSTCSGTCYLHENSGYVTSVVRTALGRYTMNFDSSRFTILPMCWATGHTTVQFFGGQGTQTSTSWPVGFNNGVNNAQDSAFTFTCVGW
jgi:hypothetical protein